MEHEVTWKEKSHREYDLLSLLEKPTVPMARLHFPEHNSGAGMTIPTYISVWTQCVQMWTQENVLSAHNHDAMILILPVRMALAQV